MSYRCSIWEKAPKICKEWPYKASDLQVYPKCGYKFDENGKRSGECNGCGECCRFMRWDTEKTAEQILATTLTASCDEFLKTTKEYVRDDPCRYREEVVE